MPRIFVATRIHPTWPLRLMLHELSAIRHVRAVEPRQLHVTLRFLGNVADGVPEQVSAAVGRAVRGMAPFRLKLCGIGAFPGRRRPSVIWTGIDNVEPLKAIVAQLDPLIDRLGFEAESRLWRAHVTLARVKTSSARLDRLLEHDADRAMGTVSIRSVDVIESRLSPHGARYTLLHAARLRR